MKIALVADLSTATCFKVAGLSEVVVARDTQEAERRLNELFGRDDLGVILVTQRMVEQIPGLLERNIEEKYPLIVPIPERRGSISMKTDLIVELIRRKAGIEVKL